MTENVLDLECGTHVDYGETTDCFFPTDDTARLVSLKAES